jgi:hypothetical protein
VRIKLTPATAPACCAETIRSYNAITGRPQGWLKPGYRIALFCKPCQHGIQFTHEDGWTRTLTEEDARTQKGAAA